MDQASLGRRNSVVSNRANEWMAERHLLIQVQEVIKVYGGEHTGIDPEMLGGTPHELY